MLAFKTFYIVEKNQVSAVVTFKGFHKVIVAHSYQPLLTVESKYRRIWGWGLPK